VSEKGSALNSTRVIVHNLYERIVAASSSQYELASLKVIPLEDKTCKVKDCKGAKLKSGAAQEIFTLTPSFSVVIEGTGSGCWEA